MPIHQPRVEPCVRILAPVIPYVKLRQAWQPGWVVTHMHVMAEQLRRGGCIQRSLFESSPQRAETIAQAKREVNERIGRFALRSGATLHLPAIYADPSNSYDICDVRGKICF